MSKQAKTATTEAKRPVGRPASFPGQDTKMFAANIPVTTSAGLVALSKQRGVPLNVLVNTIASQAIAASERARAQAANRKASKGS